MWRGGVQIIKTFWEIGLSHQPLTLKEKWMCSALCQRKPNSFYTHTHTSVTHQLTMSSGKSNHVVVCVSLDVVSTFNMSLQENHRQRAGGQERTHHSVIGLHIVICDHHFVTLLSHSLQLFTPFFTVYLIFFNVFITVVSYIYCPRMFPFYKVSKKISYIC